MDENTRMPMLEPYTVKRMVTTLSETEDYNHRMLNVPEMWKKTKGAGVKVAVLDTGCPRHRDLKIAGFADFSGSGSPYDVAAGHSTHVCGIIGAQVNGFGVRGIAPECELYCGKVLDDDGAGSISGICRGIRWAVDEVHADVINMSLGCPHGAGGALLRNTCEYAHDHGAVVCAAAGNDAGKVNSPADLPTTIGVAAVDRDRKSAYFTCHGSEVDFAAGGVDVFSTWLDDQYAKLSGTSMATPVITGAVALVIGAARAEGRKLPPEEVYERLLGIAIDVDKPGKDDYTGNGIPVFASSAPVDPEPAEDDWFARLVRWVAELFAKFRK